MSDAKRAIGDYVNRIEHATSVRELEAVFLQAMAHLGFDYAALFSCAPPAPGQEPPLSFARLPAGWLDRYLDQRYNEIDPVFAAVTQRTTPFNWSAPDYRHSLTNPQKAMLAECDEAGLRNGLAIPIQGPSGALACCMLSPSNEGIDPQAYLLGHSLAVFAYASAQRRLSESNVASGALTKRERECLFLAARGKTDWEIGEVLGISERTVHHAIENAKRRFGAATRVQAVVQAIVAGEFFATDVIG